jgi:hypothetical protein
MPHRRGAKPAGLAAQNDFVQPERCAMSDKHPNSSVALPLVGSIILTALWGVYTIITVYHIVAGV